MRRRAESGFTVTAVDCVQALQLRKTIARQFIATAFADTDVLITATVAEPPPTYAMVTSGTVDDVMARLGAFTRFTRIFNSIELPALSVPCGFTADGLPLGMQIVGSRRRCAWRTRLSRPPTGTSGDRRAETRSRFRWPTRTTWHPVRRGQ